MQGSNKERLLALAAQIVVEENQGKFSALIEELTALLDGEGPPQVSASNTETLPCPYCVQGTTAKAMTEGERGVWYQCDNCGHVVMPKNQLFTCPCLKCFELERPPSA
jgi:predicted RNA-binding Zn-ribbon protein involved in translation (DUF1610 family)